MIMVMYVVKDDEQYDTRISYARDGGASSR
jgi:hypothetical protein